MRSQQHTETLASVAIPKDIIERIKGRLHQSDFTSVDDYISHVLSEILNEVEARNLNFRKNKSSYRTDLTQADIQKIREELRPLVAYYP